MYKVYLSGPISSLSYDKAIGWTNYAKDQLSDHGIVGYKPLRGKEFLKDVTEMHAMGYSVNPMSTPKGVFARDRYDVESSDAMLINLLDAQRVSIGTMFEMAWAHMLHVPMVLIMEDGNNMHEHIFVTESAGHRVNNIDDGISLIKSILLP